MASGNERDVRIRRIHYENEVIEWIFMCTYMMNRIFEIMRATTCLCVK